MLEKPQLADELIVDSLLQNYGLQVTEVTFLPIGNDATSWVYQLVDTTATSYFLKVKSTKPHEPALVVPRLLKNRGVNQIAAPLPTVNQTLWSTAADFALILYPFIEGDTGMEKGLTPSQWSEFGAVLRQIHTTIPSDVELSTMKTESFICPFRQTVLHLQLRINHGDVRDPVQAELAQFWRNHQDEIDHLVRRTEELGESCRAIAAPQVICHADIHTANVLIANNGQLFIVDWDETLLAPVERDLMFIGGTVAREQAKHGKVISHGSESLSATELFYQGYGQADPNPCIISYYRYEWVVQEIGDYGRRVFLMDELGEETRLDSLNGFVALFEPGDVVDAALLSDH